VNTIVAHHPLRQYYTPESPPCLVERALERLAYVALWAFVFCIPWAEDLPVMAGYGIGRWMGLVALGIGLMRLVVSRCRALRFVLSSGAWQAKLPRPHRCHCWSRSRPRPHSSSACRRIRCQQKNHARWGPRLPGRRGIAGTSPRQTSRWGRTRALLLTTRWVSACSHT